MSRAARRPRRPVMLRLMLQPFEAWLGLACITTAVAFFSVDGAMVNSTIGRALHPFDVAWTLAYGFAGVVLIVGVVIGRANVIAAGLTLLTGGALVNLYALIVTNGTDALASEITLAAVIIAAALKVYGLFWASARGESDDEPRR